MKLSIGEPCKEKFDNFKPVKGGGFCDSCQKTVVDFTQMSDAQIKEFFSSSREGICGRFKESQLKEYPETTPVLSNSLVSKAAVFGIPLLTLLTLDEASAQDTIEESKTEQADTLPTGGNTNRAVELPAKENEGIFLSGRIVDADSCEGVPMVNVFCREKSIGVSTDYEGNFKFTKPLMPGDKLELSFIGYKTSDYVITDADTSGIELKLEANEIFFMGEVATNQKYATNRSVWQKFLALFR